MPFSDFLESLHKLTLPRLWLLSTAVSVVMAELIVSGMELLLKGKVSFDYLLTGMVASFLVAGVIVGILARFLGLERLHVLRETELRNELVESEKRYRSIFQTSLDVITIADAGEGLYVDVNQAFTDMSGHDRSDVIGRKGIELGLWADPEDSKRLSEVVARHGRVRNQEVRFRRKNGDIFWGLVSAAEITLTDRTYLLSFIRDITERKRAEHDIAAEKSRFQEQSIFLKTILESEPECVKIIEPDGTLAEMNRAGLAMLEVESIAEAREIGLINFVLPEYRKSFAELMKDILEGKNGRLEFEIMGKQGTLRWLETHAAPLRNAEGRITALLGITRDITERKKTDAALKLSASVFTHVRDGILITDPSGKIIDANDAFTAITGYGRDEVLGKNPRLLQSGRQPPEFYQSMWKSLDKNGVWSGEIWNRRKNGESYAELLTITSIRDEKGKLQNYIGLFTDISSFKENELKLEQIAYYDALTSLPNRRLFHDRLEQEIKKANRTRVTFGLFVVDLDRFKEVNDTLGHDVGDALLVDAARRISGCVRDTDTVSRLGGDEFTVIIPACDPYHLQKIAQNVIDALKKPFRLGVDKQAYISASIGIAVYPDDAHDMNTLMKHADQAMYSAKAAGRCRFSFFVSSMQMEAQERLLLTNDLRNALSRHEMEVHYQPIVEMKTGKIEKAEALLRWNHPVRGSVRPSLFIPLAEEFGLIHDIGNWVFLQVIGLITELQELSTCNLQVSVNRSPLEFERDPSSWGDLIESVGLEGRCIAIEITEGLLLKEAEKVSTCLLDFRERGIEVSIDDFGTGYSALSYLKRFHIDYLKIDCSFVRDLNSDENDKSLTEAIIVMAHKLGIKTIAEGVENKEQHDLLLGFGCDYAQGYYYAAPMPDSELKKRILGT